MSAILNEKINRLQEISDELELIFKTIGILRFISEAEDVKTQDNCWKIAKQLNNQTMRLYVESKIIRNDIDTIMGEYL